MPVTQPVKIMLDKERTLRLTLNAMIRFQEVTGKDLLKGFDPENMSLDDVRALLWACMLHEDKSLNLEKVGDMIDLSNLKTVIESISGAAGMAFPEPKEGDPDPNPQSP
jgi:hypothetical protein